MPPDQEPLGTDPGGTRAWAFRALRAFGAFWWDFLVSDTPELLIGTVAAIGVVVLVTRAASLNSVAVAAFPTMIAAVLALSVLRARPRRPR